MTPEPAQSIDNSLSAAEIGANLAKVRAEIAAAAHEANRDPANVTLVAVSKTHPPETVEMAIAAGQDVFGENRVQEAEAKWPALKAAHPHARLHLIGPLQSNKVRHSVTLFDVIETVDRAKLARRLADAFAETGRALDCYIQVNTGEEPQKAGVLPPDADAFITACRTEFELPVKGLMCIPPFEEPPAPHFALLSKIAERNGLDVLSMGMSADYVAAIQFGATHVRVGTAIFGARRPYP
jgi:pyridoxal phosphate enzyme (YggS family)